MMEPKTFGYGGTSPPGSTYNSRNKHLEAPVLRHSMLHTEFPEDSPEGIASIKKESFINPNIQPIIYPNIL